ncbi:MAG TPA: hypothetical protein VGE12_20415, partial [Noviherbaspirillum sp.]
RERSRWAASQMHALFAFVALVLGFTSIVFPNSLRPMSFVVFFLAGFLALAGSRGLVFNSRLLIWVLGSIVTLFYVGVGWYQRYTEAVLQVPFVYVVSPGIWLLVCSRLVADYPLSSILRTTLFFGFLGGLSVFGFYFIFLTLGPDAVRWIIKLPNIEYGSGTAAATMYVFGSLMFVAGGFFAAPQLVNSPLNKFAMAVVLVAAALLSGRTALMLSIGFGGMVFLVSLARHRGTGIKPRQAIGLIALLLMTGLVIVVAAERFGIDLARIFISVAQKVASGGGEERGAQFVALLQGMRETWFLGAGHGVGVSLIRSEEFPWRYELLWLATIYRVGVVGALIYFIPVAVIFARYAAMLASRRNSPASDFMFGGFLAAFIGAATNPYYESFEFQWMLFLPFVYFTLYGSQRYTAERATTADTQHVMRTVTAP